MLRVGGCTYTDLVCKDPILVGGLLGLRDIPSMRTTRGLGGMFQNMFAIVCNTTHYAWGLEKGLSLKFRHKIQGSGLEPAKRYDPRIVESGPYGFEGIRVTGLLRF